MSSTPTPGARAARGRGRPTIEGLESRVLFATVPAGFADTNNWVGGLSSNATAMEFAPDGRLFVCQQDGRLRVVKTTPQGTGQLLTTPFLTKTVDSNGERGLLGVAFDPGFLSNGYVYVYYTVPGTGVHNRISRFTAVDADPDPARYAPGDTAAAGSEFVLMDLDPLSSATNHNGGAIHFGLDGKLYVSVGENANAANAQTLANRLGKVLRLNPDGSIPTDNPFYNTATGVNRAIWSMGLRNPFTFAFQPGSGRMFINDVGQSSWEEIDDGRAGANYGWPTTEGKFNAAQYPSFTNPIYAYDHSGGANAITGGAFYNPPAAQQNFPSNYLGDYFFADNGAGWIHMLSPGGATPTVSGFATGINGPVDLKVGPDGALYYLARFVGRVGRIRYTGTLMPGISTQPADQTVTAGQPVTFTVTATGDTPLAYRWQRQSAGAADFTDIPDATSASYTLQSTSAADNGAKFRAVVTNNFGSATSNAATLTVNPPPPPRVVGRHVFYNDSAFDGNSPEANAADDAAIAPDKEALLPGQKATFANVTSYGNGINGVMVDVADLPATTAVTAANFNFWTSSNGTNWVAGPAPQDITVRPLSATGDGTVDRVTVIWPDGAIVDEWLQVLFNPYPTAPLPFGFDLFLFGNLRGETGDSHNTEMLRVSALDLAGLRAALPTDPAAIDNRFDFNRDRKVTALDLALVRRSLFHQLPLITAPTPPAAPGPSSLASVREEVLGGPG